MDTRSTDKKQNLLHYIVNVVEKVYPTVLCFYDDLKVDDACEGNIIISIQYVVNLQYSIFGDG